MIALGARNSYSVAEHALVHWSHDALWCELELLNSVAENALVQTSAAVAARTETRYACAFEGSCANGNLKDWR